MGNYVVLGASGGVGQEVVSILKSKGENVIACSRSIEKISFLNTPSKIFNATLPKETEDAFLEIKETHGTIDGVVNCIGSVILKPAHLTSDSEFEETLRINLWTSFGTIKASVKCMNSEGGSIVLCSTAASRIGLANHEAIAAAKGAVQGLMLSSAATYASKNIRVNCVAPGLVETGMTEKITKNPSALKFSQDMHALKRIGHPKDIAQMICFLLSPENNWITGQTFGVDGGLGTIQSK